MSRRAVKTPLVLAFYYLLNGCGHEGSSNLAVSPHNSDLPFYNNVVTIDDGKYGCSGTIVGDREVMTAAHCLIDNDTNKLVVRYKFARSDKLSIANQVVQSFVHPKYLTKDTRYDLAIVKTQDDFPAELKRIPISLHKVEPGEGLILVGFAGGVAEFVQSAGCSLLAEPRKPGELGNPDYIGSYFITPRQGVSIPSQGDSGGASLWQDSLVGVISSESFWGGHLTPFYTQDSIDFLLSANDKGFRLTGFDAAKVKEQHSFQTAGK